MPFRIDRTYHIYARSNGRFEVVPDGWSPLILLLGPLWAIANGVTLKFCGAFLVALAPALLTTWIPGSLGFALQLVSVAVAYGVVLFVSFRANEWRSQSLEAKGYRRLASIQAASGRNALRTWALSDDATRYL